MFKVLLATLLLASSVIALSINIDMIMGQSFGKAIDKAFNPFRAMDIPEIIILFMFIILFIVHQIVGFTKKLIKQLKN